MKTGVVKASLVYILIFVAKLLAFLESRAFDAVLKIVLVAAIIGSLVINRSFIANSYAQVHRSVGLLVWYKSLPADYYKKMDLESRVSLQKYLESLKPRPPKKISDIQFPAISAKSHIVVDVGSNTILSSKDANLSLPPASTAKIATALASLKLYKLNEEVMVPQFCTQVDGTKAEFLQGQKFLVGDLLKALLVYSSGDAGCVLSIGKSSYADFISLMNSVAKDAGLQNTKFTNPIGLDDADGENLASAEDLAKLGTIAVQNEFIREVVRLKEFELKDVDGKYSKKLSNTNKLLVEIPETVGIKTGTTTGAGEVLVYEYAKEKVDLIIVVMGSSDRFSDTKAVLDWTLRSYVWE